MRKTGTGSLVIQFLAAGVLGSLVLVGAWLFYSVPLRDYAGVPIVHHRMWKYENIHDPALIVDKDDPTKLLMYYSAGSEEPGPNNWILRETATVADPFVWTSTYTLILSPGAAGSWDDAGIRMGSIHVVDGVYWLYYSGWGETGPGDQGIGLATSTDGINFTRYAGNPILTYVDGAMNPSVIRVGATEWYMYWTQWEVDRNIRVSTSTDGLSWSGSAVVKANSWDVDRPTLDKAEVVKLGNVYVMIYEAWGTWGTHNVALGVAQSLDPVGTFTDYAGNPILEGDGSGFDSSHVATPALYWTGTRWLLYYQGSAAPLSPFLEPWCIGVKIVSAAGSTNTKPDWIFLDR